MIYGPGDRGDVPPGTPWPRLMDLVAAGKRVMLVSGTDYGEAMRPHIFSRGETVCSWTEPGLASVQARGGLRAGDVAGCLLLLCACLCGSRAGAADRASQHAGSPRVRGGRQRRGRGGGGGQGILGAPLLLLQAPLPMSGPCMQPTASSWLSLPQRATPPLCRSQARCSVARWCAYPPVSSRTDR